MEASPADGRVKLVVADLAGTTVDYGSCAPTGAFVELFAREGVRVTVSQAREPMGLHKLDHIRAMLNMPEVAAAWTSVKGTTWTLDDLTRLFEAFIPLQLDSLPAYCDLIPGVAETATLLQKQGVRIAATTGYNEEMMALVLERAARQGYVPDASCCAAQVPAGRPAPWMIYRCMESTGAYPPQAVVKIGDTVADVEAGRMAGAWSVGVARTGNMLGLSKSEDDALDEREREARLRDARERLRRAGADYVIDSFAELPIIVSDIEQRQSGKDRRDPGAG